MNEAARTNLASGLVLPESLHWHEGRVWFTDMLGGRVHRVGLDGGLEQVCRLDDWAGGIGWDAAGLLVVSMKERLVLRIGDDGRLSTHADLTALHTRSNDMLVHPSGWAYVGGQVGEDDDGALVAVSSDGVASVVAGGLSGPNGIQLSRDGDTLLVAESYAGRLTSFRIAEGGTLVDRELFAQLPDGTVPDGIHWEGEDAWVASFVDGRCLRVRRGGAVEEEIVFDGRRCLDCTVADGVLVVASAAGDVTDFEGGRSAGGWVDRIG